MFQKIEPIADTIKVYLYSNCVDFKYRFLSEKEFEEINDNACFSRLTYNKNYKPETGVEVEIYAYRIEKNNGFCALTEEEMSTWLTEIKQWIDYEYTLKVEEDLFTITFTTYIPRGALKILLTLIRFAFEAPFNLALKEAFIVKLKGYFPDLSILNVYQVIQDSINYSTNTNHCFCGWQEIPLLNIKELKKKIENYNDSVNGFFVNSIESNGRYTNKIKEFKIERLIDKESNLIITDEEIARRVTELYIPNFKVTYGREY